MSTQPDKMTKELHLKLVEAWWDGDLEVATRGGWMSVGSPPSILDENDHRNYRIRPKPTLRPWKPNEVPVGAEIRNLFNLKWRCMIVSCGVDGVQCIDTEIRTVTFDDLLKNCLHSIDSGKTWKPCGVKVEA